MLEFEGSIGLKREIGSSVLSASLQLAVGRIGNPSYFLELLHLKTE